MTDVPRRVLIVDQSEDSRAVLQTVLARRGIVIYEADHAGAAVAMAQSCQPDVIVLDLEAVGVDAESLFGQLDAQARGQNTPLVILGEVCPEMASLGGGQFIPKPYHYAPLVRRIEELLDESSAGIGGVVGGRQHAFSICHSRSRSR